MALRAAGDEAAVLDSVYCSPLSSSHHAISSSSFATIRCCSA